MKSCILALATAVPPHSISQEEAMRINLDVFSFEHEQKERVKKLYQNSGIEKRHTVIDDFKFDRPQWKFWGAEYPQTIPAMSHRNDLYKQEAPRLALEASKKAIDAWGGSPLDITHVISVSCTGAVIPGIEFTLMDSLGLKRSVSRLGMNFMGCFGAFKGLEVASSLAKENGSHRILIVCTELCSLHLQADISPDTLLANSIFADGAAAAIVGALPRENEQPLWEIFKHASYGLEDSTHQMGWEAGDRGFLMKLSGFVPVSIAKNIEPFSKVLLEPHISSPSLCHWAIHPGGKAVLQVIEKKLKLEKWQTQAAWDTLAHYGNMSSATFLFVLEKLYQKSPRQKWSAGLGFGPGLSIEGILLQTP